MTQQLDLEELKSRLSDESKNIDPEILFEIPFENLIERLNDDKKKHTSITFYALNGAYHCGQYTDIAMDFIKVYQIDLDKIPTNEWAETEEEKYYEAVRPFIHSIDLLNVLSESEMRRVLKYSRNKRANLVHLLSRFNPFYNWEDTQIPTKLEFTAEYFTGKGKSFYYKVVFEDVIDNTITLFNSTNVVISVRRGKSLYQAEFTFDFSGQILMMLILYCKLTIKPGGKNRISIHWIDDREVKSSKFYCDIMSKLSDEKYPKYLTKKIVVRDNDGFYASDTSDK